MSDESCQRFKGFKITPNYTHQQKRLHKKRRLLFFHWYMFHEILIYNKNEMNPKVEKFHLVQKSIRNSSLFFPLMCGHFLL